MAPDGTVYSIPTEDVQKTPFDTLRVAQKGAWHGTANRDGRLSWCRD